MIADNLNLHCIAKLELLLLLKTNYFQTIFFILDSSHKGTSMVILHLQSILVFCRNRLQFITLAESIETIQTLTVLFSKTNQSFFL